MDVSNLLGPESAPYEDNANNRRGSRQSSIRYPAAAYTPQSVINVSGAAMGPSMDTYAGSAYSRPVTSPIRRLQKHVTFELLLPMPQHRARLPMRVMISPHDTTESIITTVKNFYGLYEGPGISFQNKDGTVLIAAYDNFENDMTIYVRITPEEPTISASNDRSVRNSLSPRKPKLGAPFEMRPPAQPSRPASRTANGRSASPQSNRSHRSVSAAPGAKSRSRTQASQDPSGYNDLKEDDYSSSDGGNGSVTSSRRSRAEAHASAEISVENIVEGGRRKRAKFESSELPLFVPPQVPVATSISSVSPQRRATGEYTASPMLYSNQRTFAYTQPSPSPQSYGRLENQYNGQSANVWAQPLPYSGHQLRGRGPISYQPPRQSTGGILPTPEPTVGSVISDEDVALQLMRLGDVSNFSHGRTSTSTVDDALSGKAEAASSVEDSDEDDAPRLPSAPSQMKSDHEAGPRRKKQRMLNENNIPSDSMQSSGDEYHEGADESFKGESDEIMPLYPGDGANRKLGKSKSTGALKSRGSISSVSGSTKSGKSRALGSLSNKTKINGKDKVPMSPASLPAQSRKGSISSAINFHNPLLPDEDDLSSKPRCQRCRKSKKGCDRQRPCGRCKDAGIGVEGCVSEDEGNGRRGRYGRHMGVALKKDGSEGADDNMSPPALPLHAHTHIHGQFLAPALPMGDKNKKRKR